MDYKLFEEKATPHAQTDAEATDVVLELAPDELVLVGGAAGRANIHDV